MQTITTQLYSWQSISKNPTLIYARDVISANRHLAPLLLSRSPLGFDLEWPPTFIKRQPEHPVALVQLATSDSVFLIQISAMDAFPELLRLILESPHIVKAGVGIQGDVKKLHHDRSISTRNCVDLSLLARSVDNPRWKGRYSNPIGLARLVESYKHLILKKGRISYSNWAAVLTAEQQEYAANDAHAGSEIYAHLLTLLPPVSPPAPVCYTFDFVRGRLCEPSGAHWFPRNPNYDPGPPPPPKVPKADAVSVVGPATTDSIVSSAPSAHGNKRFRRAARGRAQPSDSLPSDAQRPATRWRPRYLAQQAEQPDL